MDYDELIAPAAKAMRPSGIRKFFDLAAEMPHCICLGVGEPDFKTPWAVRKPASGAWNRAVPATPPTRASKSCARRSAATSPAGLNLHYEPSQVLVTVGGSEAIDMCIRALVQPGDEVIIPEPCFVCYEPITTLTGGVPVHIATRQEDEFRLTADQLARPLRPRPSWSSCRSPTTPRAQ